MRIIALATAVCLALAPATAFEIDMAPADARAMAGVRTIEDMAVGETARPTKITFCHEGTELKLFSGEVITDVEDGKATVSRLPRGRVELTMPDESYQREAFLHVMWGQWGVCSRLPFAPDAWFDVVSINGMTTFSQVAAAADE